MSQYAIVSIKVTKKDMTANTPMIITPDFEEKQKQQQSLFAGIIYYY